jgi:hypothetical protein
MGERFGSLFALGGAGRIATDGSLEFKALSTPGPSALDLLNHRMGK